MFVHLVYCIKMVVAIKCVGVNFHCTTLKPVLHVISIIWNKMAYITYIKIL